MQVVKFLYLRHSLTYVMQEMNSIRLSTPDYPASISLAISPPQNSRDIVGKAVALHVNNAFPLHYVAEKNLPETNEKVGNDADLFNARRCGKNGLKQKMKSFGGN